MEKVNLEKKDFDFIDKFCDKYNIPEGFGHKRFFAQFLHEHNKNDKCVETIHNLLKDIKKLKLKMQIMRLKPKLEMLGYTWDQQDNMKIKLKRLRKKLRSL